MRNDLVNNSQYISLKGIFRLIVFLLILTFGNKKTLSQNVILENPPNIQPSPFLRTWPSFPTLLNSSVMQLGYNYVPRNYRFDVYGGGIRNGYSSTGLGSPYMKWQQQGFWTLQTSLLTLPSGINYTPGIRYLGNRHNWLGYAATFGLKERQTTQVSAPGNQENFWGSMLVDNNLGKDAVIAMEYPKDLGESLRPNLNFESIALDTTIGGSDQLTTLATLTNSGNLGFRTPTPLARIDIYGTEGMPNPGAGKPFKAISVGYPGAMNAYKSNFALTTSADGSLIGMGTDLPLAKIYINGMGGMPAADINNRFNQKIISYNSGSAENPETFTVLSGKFIPDASPATTGKSDNKAKLWMNYDNANPPAGYELFMNGTMQVVNDIEYNNSTPPVPVAGTEFTISNTAFGMISKYGNQMKLEEDGQIVKVSDVNYSYLEMGNNAVKIPIIKDPNHSASFVTIDDQGKLSRTNNNPPDVIAWNPKLNTFAPGDDAKFGTTATSDINSIDIYLKGNNYGVIRHNPIKFLGNYSGYEKDYGEFNFRGRMSLGGEPVNTNLYATYPAGETENNVTLQIVGTNHLNYTYKPPVDNNPYYQSFYHDFNAPTINIKSGFPNVIYENPYTYHQVGMVSTFTVYQNGIVRMGHFSNYNSPTTVGWSNPIGFDGALMIGEIAAAPTVKYAIKVVKPNDYANTQFAVGYDNGKVYFGANSIMDPYGHNMYWDGHIKPYTSGGSYYDIGGNSTLERWNKGYFINGTVGTSDIRMKKNINSVDSALKIVMKLNPKTFNWKDGNIDQMLHYGFVAQELKQIFQNSIVIGNEATDTLGVMYSEIIPILTRAIQEQQKLIQSQTEKLDKLNKSIFVVNHEDSMMSSEVTNGILNDVAVLFQNNPNPFSTSTYIDYFVPKGAFQAAIAVYDETGKMVLSYDIPNSGLGRVMLDADKLSASNYLYSLTVNGKVIDTKKMQLVKN